MSRLLGNLLYFAVAIACATAISACATNDPDNPDPDPVVPVTPGDEFDFNAPQYTVSNVEQLTSRQIMQRYFNFSGGMTGGFDFDPELITDVMEAYNLFSAREKFVTDSVALIAGSHAKYTPRYTRMTINYQSIDEKGNPITLSGLVTYQVLCDANGLPRVNEVNQVVIDNHFTITSNAECPSLNGSILDMWHYTVPAVVISADYQGYGASVGSKHPYLNEELTARQQVDLVRCALTELRNRSNEVMLTDDYKTYSVGYSQGGAVALAVQKYLELQDRNLMKRIQFAGSICGDGPYDMCATLDFYLSTGCVSMPVILPMVVDGMITSYPDLFDGKRTEDFFSEAFLNTCRAYGGVLNALASKKYSTMDFDKFMAQDLPAEYGMTCKMGNMVMDGTLSDAYVWQTIDGGIHTDPTFTGYDITKLMSADATDLLFSPESGMYKALKRNNVIEGWTPTRPVYFFHCAADNVVPLSNLRALVTRDGSVWPTNIYNINCNWKYKDHASGGIAFYVALMRTPSLASNLGSES